MSQIKDLAVGDGYIYLMENGQKVKFYVLAHNYESDLNGKGRTLVVRESPVTSGAWSNVKVNNLGTISAIHNSCGWSDYKMSTIAWKEPMYCVISCYLNDTYPNLFSTETKSWISTTQYYAYHGSGTTDRGKNTPMGSAMFTVSAAESVSGLTQGKARINYTDGTLLSYEARKRLEQIFTAYGGKIWTRSPSYRPAYSSNDDYYYAGVELTGVSDSEWGDFRYNDTTTGINSVLKDSCGYLPCFTLPETLYVTDEGFATENQPPELTSTAGKSGTDLGEKNAPFALSYTVTDSDGDTMTVTEKLDGQTSKLRTGVASGTALTFEQTNTAAGFQKILNGSHTLAVNVSDGKSSSDFNATFTKAVHAASVTLAEPLAVDGDITVAVLQVTGSIPEDATFKAEVTNNAKDAAPVWQDATTEVQKGTNIVFANSTATNGAAFNFRVSVERGESGEGGFIESISGAFQ